ncbi:MAG: hypothetical protein IPP77_09840 [Bacteroidetes bacterium]|nr:hypothetical protein [Bacteroidota bacterium]
MKRIFLSLSAFTRYGGFVLAIILVLGIFDFHSLYDHVKHIMHTSPVPAHYSTKVIYFSTAFWVGRVVLYAVLWYAFSIIMDNFFARTDQTDPKVYKKSKLLSAAFIVVFAVTESAVSWDMIMSLDTHWYSTLFGWYNFASYGCGAWAMTILLVIYLKSLGYLQRVNENHVHDLGKMLFGFSILWAYMWFDQIMLQWFANMPEETSFWIKRFDVDFFKGTIFLSLIINFVFPLFFLIKRGPKRNFKMIGFGAALLVFGHYLDFFNYTFVEPNWNKEEMHQEGGLNEEAMNKNEKVVFYAEAGQSGHAMSDATKPTQNTDAVVTEVKAHGHAAAEGHISEEAPEKNFAGIGIGELLIFVGFLGVFLYLFFKNLAKRPIIPENDPYLKEGEKLVVTYA